MMMSSFSAATSVVMCRWSSLIPTLKAKGRSVLFSKVEGWFLLLLETSEDFSVIYLFFYYCFGVLFFFERINFWGIVRYYVLFTRIFDLQAKICHIIIVKEVDRPTPSQLWFLFFPSHLSQINKVFSSLSIVKKNGKPNCFYFLKTNQATT